jgi:hypothetical protein
MNEAVIREKLLEISEAISASQETQNTEGLYLSDKAGTVEQAIDELRMKIKYLVFDLEASRRENRYLRQMLEARPPRPGKEDDGGDWR